MKTQFDNLMEDPEFRRYYAIEGLVTDASETIARLMAEQKITKAELARRLKKSRSWVTQMLSGTENLTVRTLAEAVYALGAEIRLETYSCVQPQVRRSDSFEERSASRVRLDLKTDPPIHVGGVVVVTGPGTAGDLPRPLPWCAPMEGADLEYAA